MTRTYDPNDESQVAERQDSAALARQQQEADWRWLTAAPQGRRILAELMAHTGFVQPAFSEQPLVMAMLEGKRSVGHHVYARVMEAVNGADLPALMAEVMVPPNVRRAEPRDARRRRPDA